MPRPVAFANGIYHLNVRVPKDLADRLRGTCVTLPLGALDVTVKIGDKVILSLRTRDPKQAKVRFQQAEARLDLFFAAMRAQPKPLSYRDVVALSGDFYRSAIETREAGIEPGHFDSAQADFEADVHALMYDDLPEGSPPGMPRDEAEFYASLMLPDGGALVAWASGGLRTPTFRMGEEEALEHLFGRQADTIATKRGVRLDPTSRLALLREIGHAQIRSTARLKQMADGDFSPDPHVSRFPDFQGQETVTVAGLFERWKAHNADKVEASTARRYTPTPNSLAAFLRDKDVRRVEEDDLWAWAEHRRDVGGIAARTVNRNDLVAASSVFAFAMSRDGGRIRTTNPVKGVKLDEPKRRKLRERSFRSAEIKAILTLSRRVRPSRVHPEASASRRWVPWICAYLGARVQEPCWLEKRHFRIEDGIWVVEFPQTKDASARVVPLHDALLDEGLVDFVRSAPEGLLFVRPRKGHGDRTVQEQRASELASWIQENVGLDDGVDPNHGWRHTWISTASSDSVNISKRHQNAINGHNRNQDASDGYVQFPIRDLKAALDRYPGYRIE